MNPTQKAYLELHFAVLLFGFTAILGDLISLNALELVWWRVFLTCLSLGLVIRLGRRLRKMALRTILQYMGIGILVALHWLTFFGAVKLANASITLIAMATTSLFSALVEPFILRQRLQLYEILLGLMIIPGMILIVSSTDFSLLYGLGVGFLSAFFVALFTSLNKKMIGQADELTITFLELGSAWLFLSLVIPVIYWSDIDLKVSFQFWPDSSDWPYLLFLALGCTTLAYVLALRALRHLSAFASNLTINLEPVYGIVLAWLILKENKELSVGFYVGVVIILIVVFSYPFLKKRFDRKLS
jgi:drug/metabolite transporter (DMT)-like permease